MCQLRRVGTQPQDGYRRHSHIETSRLPQALYLHGCFLIQAVSVPPNVLEHTGLPWDQKVTSLARNASYHFVPNFSNFSPRRSGTQLDSKPGLQHVRYTHTHTLHVVVVSRTPRSRSPGRLTYDCLHRDPVGRRSPSPRNLSTFLDSFNTASGTYSA